MRRLVLLAVLAGCASSAPHTMGSAALNSAIAVGASAAQRAAGGCYAQCTPGTTCNERTGMCEKIPCGGSCQGLEICVQSPAGDERCVSTIATGGEKRPATGEVSEKRPSGAEGPPIVPKVGVSPATGTVQPPPAEASPTTGPRP